jgi:hypothetical protein
LDNHTEKENIQKSTAAAVAAAAVAAAAVSMHNSFRGRCSTHFVSGY